MIFSVGWFFSILVGGSLVVESKIFVTDFVADVVATDGSVLFSSTFCVTTSGVTSASLTRYIPSYFLESSAKSSTTTLIDSMIVLVHKLKTL